MAWLSPLLLCLAACGGGGAVDNPLDNAVIPAPLAVSVASPAADAPDVAAAPLGDVTPTVANTGASAPEPSASTAATGTTTATGTLVATGDGPASGTGTGTAPAPAAITPARSAPAVAPAWPRASITAAELAVIVAEGDPTSEAIGLAYQRARGVPEANMVRVSVPAGNATITAERFAQLKAEIDAKLPAQVQATLLTFTQPSRVQGPCAMGITSAMAMGYSAALCGGCSRTQASAYFDSDTTRPYTDLRIRPSMMLGASTLAQAQTLIQRGLAAEGSAPTGVGWLVRTSDGARSVRYPDFQSLPAAWSTTPGLDLRYVDASADASKQLVRDQDKLLFYFTGLVQVSAIDSNRWLPGAVADHLTSTGGVLSGESGQMPATEWLTGGATASYGTVEEPCNYTEKFAKASVLIDHYLRGATVIEAYWKSVAWPGQGLFLGEPLARPWPDAPVSQFENGQLLLQTRALRRNGRYRVDWRPDTASSWRTLASLTAGQPRPTTWRVTLPAEASASSQWRWMGPCPTAAALTCVLGSTEGP